MNPPAEVPTRPRSARWLSLGWIVPLAAALALYLAARRAPAGDVAAGPASPTEAAALEPALSREGEPSASARAPAEEAPPSEPAPAPLGRDELLEALRRLARAELADSKALEAILRPLLVPPSTVDAVLELLKGGGLADGSTLALEEQGALRLMALAALVFNPPLGVENELGLAVDGHAFLVRVLRALPDLLPPVQEHLADLLSGQRDQNGRPLLDLSFAEELRALAAAYPELAELYQRLLAELAAELHPTEGAAFDELELARKENPELVEAALGRWLEKDRASAVAEGAPVDEATEFLSQRADRMLLGEFFHQGSRPGALPIIEDEYWRLRILGDGDVTSRVMLVSGMESAGTERLLALAAEEPSPEVRAQAWTTLTVAKGFVPSAGILDRLRDTWINTADPVLGVPTYGILSAAGNFASRARKRAPELVRGAVDLMMEIADDPSTAPSMRERALDSVRRLVTPEEFEQLQQRR